MKLKNIINLLSLLVAVSFVLTGCSDSLDETDVREEGQLKSWSIQATIEQPAPSTRTDISFAGEIAWNVSDHIGVYGTEHQNVLFHYSLLEQDGNDFTGNFDTQKEFIRFALFPYDREATLDQNKLSFTICQEQKYHTENKAPMIGLPISDQDLRFYQGGGALALQLIGIPEEAHYIQVTSTGENAPLLAGKAVVEDVTQAKNTYKITEGSPSIRYNLSGETEKESLKTLYVPLQVGNYPKLTVSVCDIADKEIKKVSLSDVEVTRAKLIRTPTVHCSDKVYYGMLSEKTNEILDTDYALLTSSNWIAGAKTNEDSSTTYTYVSVNGNHKGDNHKLLEITTDSDNRITEIVSPKIMIGLVYKENGKADVLFITDKETNTLKDISLPAQTTHSTRGGIEESHVFETLNNYVGIVELLIEYAATGVIGPSLEFIRDWAIETLIINNLPEKVQEIIEFFDKSALQRSMDVLVEMKKQNNEMHHRYYRRLCGNTFISVLKPKVEGDKIKFGYIVLGTNTIPNDFQRYIRITRLAQIQVHTCPNGQFISERTIKKGGGGEIFGQQEVTSDVTRYFELPYREGYTYYFSAKIYVASLMENGLDPYFQTVTFYSDTHTLSTHNIDRVEVNSVKYRNGKLCYDINVWGNFVDYGYDRNWGAFFYCDDKRVNPVSHFKLSNYNRYELEIDADQMNLDYTNFLATTLGRWTVRTFVDTDVTFKTVTSEPTDFKLTYDQKPSVSFINPVIQQTITHDESPKSRADDDDKTKKYTTFFSYGIDIKGGFWFDKLLANSSNEGTMWSLSFPHGVQYDGPYAFDYSWTYSEKKPITPEIWYHGDIGPNRMESKNKIKFTGMPLSNVHILFN